MSWVAQKAQAHQHQQRARRDPNIADATVDDSVGNSSSARRRSSPPPSSAPEKQAGADLRTSSARSLQRRSDDREHNVETLMSQITERSNEIVEQVMNWKTGAREHDSKPRRADEIVLQARRKRDWLRAQLQFYQSYLEQDNAETLSEDMPDEALHEKEIQLYEDIEKLQEKIYEASTVQLQEQLLLQRVLEQPVLLELVFPSNPNAPSTPMDELLRKLFRTRDEQVTSLLNLYEDVSAVQDERFEIQQKIRKLRISNRQKWRQHKQKKHIWESSTPMGVPPSSEAANADPEVKRLEKDIGTNWNHNLLLRRVTQAIIMHSGINWAADPHWRKFFLQLEDPPVIAPSETSVDPAEAAEEEALREAELELEAQAGELGLEVEGPQEQPEADMEHGKDASDVEMAEPQVAAVAPPAPQHLHYQTQHPQEQEHHEHIEQVQVAEVTVPVRHYRPQSASSSRQQQPSLPRGTIIKKPQPAAVSAGRERRSIIKKPRSPRRRSAYSDDGMDEDDDDEEEFLDDGEIMEEDDGGEYEDSSSRRKSSSSRTPQRRRRQSTSQEIPVTITGRESPAGPYVDPVERRLRELVPMWTRKLRDQRSVKVREAKHRLAQAGYSWQTDDPNIWPEDILLGPPPPPSARRRGRHPSSSPAAAVPAAAEEHEQHVPSHHTGLSDTADAEPVSYGSHNVGAYGGFEHEDADDVAPGVGDDLEPLMGHHTDSRRVSYGSAVGLNDHESSIPDDHLFNLHDDQPKFAHRQPLVTPYVPTPRHEDELDELDMIHPDELPDELT